MRVSGACQSIAAPRLKAPLSTAKVTSNRPTFLYELAEGADGARIDVCRDRECAEIVTSFSGSKDSATPPEPLPAGMLFWRARASVGATEGKETSKVWQVAVANRAEGKAMAYGSTPDFNGDGFADLLVGARGLGYSNFVKYFPGGAQGLDFKQTVIIHDPPGLPSDIFYGSALALAGDVNGDGFVDALVGAPCDVYSFGICEESGSPGEVDVHLGSPDGLAGAPHARITPSVPDMLIGEHIAGAGDVNADGYADVLISGNCKNNATDALCRSGFVYLYLGGPDGLAANPAITLTSPEVVDSPFGTTGWYGQGALGSAGDLDGDGFGDVVVGAPLAPGHEVNEFGGHVACGGGLLYIYRGGPGGLEAAAAAVLSGTKTEESCFMLPLGLDYDVLGDANGDGLADLLTGDTVDGQEQGVLLLSTGDLSAPTALRVADLAYTELIGDVNGDGYVDAASAEPNAQVFLGSSGGLMTPAYSNVSLGTSEFSYSVGWVAAGDVNGDGFDDALFTDPCYLHPYPNSGNCAGRVVLFSGTRFALVQGKEITDADVENFGCAAL